MRYEPLLTRGLLTRLTRRRAGGVGLRRNQRQSLVLVLGQTDVPSQAQHLEQIGCMVIYVREDQAGAVLLDDINHAHKNRDTDAVNQLGVSEIDHQRATARLELSFAFALDALPAQLIEIIAGIDDCRVSSSPRLYRVRALEF